MLNLITQINDICNNIANVLPESKRINSILSKKSQLIIDNQLHFQSELWVKYGNGDLLRLYGNLGYIEAIFEYLSDICDNCMALNIFKAIFYDMIILNYFWIDPNDNPIKLAISMQIAYKNFPITLSSLSDFCRLTNLSNEEMINKVIQVLQSTEEEIVSYLKCDRKLYPAISNAIGSYLSDIFEKDKNNKPKNNYN